MLDRLDEAAIRLADAILGWLLDYPREVTILALAAASSVLLVVARRIATDQDHLRRCALDKMRLKALIREAKASGKADRLKRHRRTLGMVETMRLKAEVGPFLIALPPVVLLALWGFQRLEYLPPLAGKPFRLAVYFPQSAVGELVHLVPDESINVEGGWVREVELAGGEDAPHGMAAWTLKAEARPDPYQVEFRHGDATYRKTLRVGQRTYEPPVDVHDEHVTASEVMLDPVKPFGIVPGFPRYFIPSWLLAYLILVLPLTALCRKLGKVS